MGLDYRHIVMFGVNLTKQDKEYDEEEFRKDFHIEDEDDVELMTGGEIGYINTGGCCDGDDVIGVLIDYIDTEDEFYEEYSTHELMDRMMKAEAKYYDILEKYGVTKKYGKGKFIIFNYIW